MISWKNERVEPAAGYVLLVVLSLCIKMKRRAERGRPAGICVPSIFCIVWRLFSPEPTTVRDAN